MAFERKKVIGALEKGFHECGVERRVSQNGSRLVWDRDSAKIAHKDLSPGACLGGGGEEGTEFNADGVNVGWDAEKQVASSCSCVKDEIVC